MADGFQNIAVWLTNTSMLAETVGLLAGVFVILAFYSKRAKRLRAYAILSNILFILYALSEWLVPVVLLHAVLLPLNIMRLYQIDTATPEKRVGLIAAAEGPCSPETPPRQASGSRRSC